MRTTREKQRVWEITAQMAPNWTGQSGNFYLIFEFISLDNSAIILISRCTRVSMVG